MNGYCITVKTFLRSVDSKQPKMSNFHFDLSLKLPHWGEVQDFSGEVQNNLRGGGGGCAPRHTSPQIAQNPAMIIIITN
jgi:hypothetical protein